MPASSCDLLITATETNSHHGAGILLQRLFPDSAAFVCIRTTSLYNGEEPFGSAHHELCSRHLTLAETEDHIRRILANYTVRRILCVPYYREDFIHAILAKRITGAPLCTFLMDDQNIFAPHVPDHWVGDLLEASDLRLGISPELCAAYRRKFGRDVQLLPPVLEKGEPLVPCYWHAEPTEPVRAAMIGNIWTATRFEELRALLRATGLHIDWYGNGANASWLPGSPEEWEADNIRCLGFFPEEDLIAALASYPFILVPSGNLDADDDNPAFSRLSLPSRLFFLHARTTTPVMILGSSDTAAGRFVTRHGTGICVTAFQEVMDRELPRLFDPIFRKELQLNIRRIAPSLAFPEGGQWLWEALTGGQIRPAGFQKLFPDDYLAGASWLEAIQPPRPRPRRRFPVPHESFHDDRAPSFGFLRDRHLPVLAATGLDLPAKTDVELSSLNGAVAHYIICGAQPMGGDVLFLGTAIPPVLQNLPPTFRLWRIADLASWQRAGYAGDTCHVVDAKTTSAYPLQFPQFAAIVSTSWCGELGDDRHSHEGLALYLDACTAPGGINLHLFTAVLHPTYFWVGSAYGYMRRRFIGAADWPDHDELLASGDCFFMSEAAYAKHWQASTGKSYAECGKPLSMALFWRKPHARPDN